MRHPKIKTISTERTIEAPADLACERFGLPHAVTGNGDEREKQGTALSKRTPKELVQDEKVAWTTHTMPNLDASAMASRALHAEGRCTRAAVDGSISVPTVVERVGRVMFRHVESSYEEQLNAAIDTLKTVSEAEVRPPIGS